MVSHTAAAATLDRVYRRIAWRLVPFLFACYVCAYLDRVNVGFAKLRMLDDLGMSEAVYGLGAGIFFLGYFLFEVPSNLLMLRIGARRTIARIMIAWGIISAATMLVKTPAAFYTLRFLLGVAEAGFFPGVIFYLTLWFPAARRGRIIALFTTAVAISIVIGGPVSGLIMAHLDGAHGLAGWQWLFVLEALPSIAMGFAALFWLTDQVSDATWLSAEERALVARDLAADNAGIKATGIADGLRSRWIWLLAAIYFFLVMGLYGLNFWLPTVIRELGYESIVRIGFINAVPFIAATVVMVLVGRSADRHAERRWHVLVPAVCGAAGLAASVVFHHQPVIAIAALTFAACGIFAAIPQAWGLASALVTGSAAAAGIAMINSIGNLSGFVAPFAIGKIKEATGATSAGMLMLAVSLIIGALLVLVIPARLVNRPAPNV